MYQNEIVECLRPFSPNNELLRDMVIRVASRMEAEPLPPSMTVAGPAMDACLWSDDLMREHYANLLASSMDTEKRSIIHPAFVPLIRQMDALDCAFLLKLSEKISFGVANCYLCRTQKTGGFLSREIEARDGIVKIIQRMTEYMPSDGDYARVQAAIDNLLRLQLIEIHFKPTRDALTDIHSDTHETIYMMFSEIIDQTVKEFCERFPQFSNGQIRLRLGHISLTAFGQRFVRTCLL